METIFKVNQKVYDQINYPDKEGRIIEINKEIDDRIFMEVQFMSKEKPNKRNVEYYSLSGVKYFSNFPSLSTKPYTVELKGFEQKESIPDFDEMWKRPKKSYKSHIEHYSVYPTQELADAFEALRRLLFIIDYYNEGWQPDWNDDTIRKYNILTELGKVEKGNNFSANRILSFRTEEIRDKFLEDQKELLEIAKPLL